jgi:DHA2 family multidrug resistance protein
MIIAFAMTAIVAFLILIPWEWMQEQPIIALRMFRNRNFALTNFFMLLVGMIIFGTTLFIPQFLQGVLGYTSMEAGLALTYGGFATIITMPIAGALTGRVDARILVGLAFVIQGLALWNMSGLNTQIAFGDAATARMWQSVGIPFLFIPITTVAYVGLRPEENNQASAMMNVVRNLGGSIGIAGIQVVLTHRQQFHQARYVEQLNPLNPNFNNAVQSLANNLTAHGVPPNDATPAAMAEIYRALIQQTMMLSYVEAFHIMMIIIFASLPLVLLLRAPAKTRTAHMDVG